MEKKCCTSCWISLILRVAVASLFAVAAFDKFRSGLDNTTMFIQGMFKDTWLPLSLVGLYARILPFAEAIIAIWLIVGYKLKTAWILTAFVLITLAFGMAVAKQFAVVANNYFYVFLACAGLYFSCEDCCSIDGILKKSN